MIVQKPTSRQKWLRELDEAKADQRGGMTNIDQSCALARRMLFGITAERPTITLLTGGQSRRGMSANSIGIQDCLI